MTATDTEMSVQRPQLRRTVTVEEAAAMLGIARATAYHAVKRGEIPTVRVGRRLLVPLARLRALLGEDEGVGDEMS